MNLSEKISKDPITSSLIGSSIYALICFFCRNILLEWTNQSIWISSLIIILVLLAILLFFSLIYQKCRYNQLYDTLFDKKLELVSNHYFYTFNNETKALDLDFTGERKIKCINNSISYEILGLSTKDCFLNPEISSDAVLVGFIRSDNKKVELKGIHKITPSNIQLKVNFIPKLLPGESVYFKYEFSIKSYKIGTKEVVRNRGYEAIIDIDNYEHNGFTVHYPIENFRFKVEFDKSCKIDSADILVFRNTEQFIEEEDTIKKGNNFVLFNPNASSYSVFLQRKNPPLKAYYKITWEPPGEKEFTAPSRPAGVAQSTEYSRPLDCPVSSN